VDYDILAILFVAFSVISSLVKRWQQRQKDNQRTEEGGRGIQNTEHEVPDLSEWDVLEDPEPEESIREFREVRGTRSVTEEYAGQEFQEVQGTRPISEQTFGPEFRDPLVEEDKGSATRRMRARTSAGREIPVDSPRMNVRKRITRLQFDRNALVNAVLYKEILGPPRGEDVPW